MDGLIGVAHILENENHNPNKPSPKQEFRVEGDELKVARDYKDLQGDLLSEVRSHFVGWIVEWIAASEFPFLLEALFAIRSLVLIVRCFLQ